MEKRVGTTKQAASHFGFIDDRGLPNIRAFMAWTKANKVTPIHGEIHHLWWDFKSIEQKLDKNAGIKPKSSIRDIIKQRMAQHGKVHDSVPAH
jgi:hypothetical protein